MVLHCHPVELVECCLVKACASLTIPMLREPGTKPLKSRRNKVQASLTLLAVEREDSNFGITLFIRAVNEAISLVTIDHVAQSLCENIIAAILTFFLPSMRVNVGYWYASVKSLSVE